MKILYLSQRFSFEKSGIYADLMNALAAGGADVTIVSCRSDKEADYDKIKEQNNCKMLHIKVADQFGANMIKKAYVQMRIPSAMIHGIKKHLWHENYDLILYPTPPITFAPVVKKCKKHFNTKTFLMLKDIFPQNAVDLGMIRENSIIHRAYKKIEKELYNVSDCIGCMSMANKKYIAEHCSKEIAKKTIIFPNTINCEQLKAEQERVYRGRDKETVFLFGGNMGKPQDVGFLLDCIYELRDYSKAKFLLVGSGSETGKIEQFIKNNKVANVEFHSSLPRMEYEKIVSQSDVGIVLLNYKFTIPNFPARTLSYLAKGIPILAATDMVTDVRNLVEEDAKCGLWCASNDKQAFCEAVKKFCEMEACELEEKGQNGYKYLKENYTVEKSYEIICTKVSYKE